MQKTDEQNKNDDYMLKMSSMSLQLSKVVDFYGSLLVKYRSYGFSQSDALVLKNHAVNTSDTCNKVEKIEPPKKFTKSHSLFLSSCKKIDNAISLTDLAFRTRDINKLKQANELISESININELFLVEFEKEKRRNE